MGVGAGLYMYVVVVQKFTFAISSPDEFLFWQTIIGYYTAKATSHRHTLRSDGIQEILAADLGFAGFGRTPRTARLPSLRKTATTIC